MQKLNPDIFVTNGDRYVLAGWVWNIPQGSEAAAAEKIELLARDYRVPDSEFYSLFSQDWIYIWRRTAKDGFDLLSKISAVEIFEQYFGPTLSERRVQGAVLRDVAMDWLARVANDDFRWREGDAARNEMEHIGLIAALRGAVAMADVS